MTAPAPAPAWYQDPYDTARVRWWNGEAWTTAVRQHPAASTAVPAPSPAVAPTAPLPPASPPPCSLPPTPLDPSGAPSIGAARLPPLTPPKPPGSVPNEPDAGHPVDGAKRSRRLMTVLLAGVAVAALALAYAAYSTGMIGASARDASTEGATLVEGPGFSLEAPDGWSQVDRGDEWPPNVVVVLRGPGGAELGVVRSDDPIDVPDDPEIRRRMVDLMIATQTSVITDAAVLSREPATLGGAEAEVMTVQGVTAAGETEQAYQAVALHDGRMYLLILAGPPDLVADSKAAFDAIVASFRFDD